MIVGGGGTGLETAHMLSQQKKEVTVVEMLERAGADLGATIRWILLNKIRELGVKVLTSTQLVRIVDTDVVMSREGDERVFTGYDTIILAAGTVSCTALKEELRDMPVELLVIGDSEKPGNAADAIRSGAEAGIRI